MKISYIRDHCNDCSACDHHYPGIRTVAEVHAAVGFSAGTWGVIESLVRPAVDACKTDALVLEDDG